MERLPAPTAERISRYMRICLERSAQGVTHIYSQTLAEAANVNANSVRKDISLVTRVCVNCSNIQGDTNKGYEIARLVSAFRSILGIDREQEIVLVGVGHIGQALLNYNGFSKRNFRITAAFDSDPGKVHTIINGIECRFAAELPGFLSGNPQVKMGILAVPAEYARDTARLLVKNGIRSILNFSPVSLGTETDIDVIDIDLVSSLCVLSHFGQTE